MAYLIEHLSRQELSILPQPGKKCAVVANQTVSNVNVADHSEHRNFQIARDLKEEKTKLINALSQFPVVAFYLLKEYEKNACLADQDDEITLRSDTAIILANIKKYYASSSISQAMKFPSSSVHVDEKQNLASALKLFPFSFEDLVRMTDLIVYAYKVRGAGDQVSNAKAHPDSDLIIKRLAAIKQCTRSYFSKLTGLFNDGDEPFLFLSDEEIRDYLPEIVIAEHHWLNARQELSKANAKLVLFIANQYKAGFLDFDDLVQEGQTGLLKAVDRFDYRLGFQFSTYAGYWIRQAISRSLSRCERLVRVPCGQVANINKVYRAKNEIMSQTGQEASVKELADYTKLSDDEINAILSIAQTTISLEGTDDEENAYAPIDFLEQQVFSHPFKTIAESDLEQLLCKAIEMLNPREAKVICAHFGIDTDREMTLQEIGSELNLTRERVRQIQVMALQKIKINFGQQLMCFL